jgi:hypothetical protein
VRIVAVGDGHEIPRIDHDAPVRAVAFGIEARPAAHPDEHEIDATLHRRPLATEFEHNTAVSRRNREPKKAFDRRSRSTILALSY